MAPIVFMLCFTLHNIEETLWLPGCMAKTFPKRMHTKKEHFIFAVLGITILGYITAGLFALYPDNQLLEYAFIGFVSAMAINAVVPHLLLTIRYRKYCPGVLTGCFLIIPLHTVILSNAVNSRMKVIEIVIATVIVGLLLLGAAAVLKAVAKKMLDME